MSHGHDPSHPASRPTIKAMPSQDGLDDFDEAELTHPQIRAPEAATAGAAPPPAGVEVDIVHEKGISQRPAQWRAFEVWTAKSVYAIDGQMMCIGVMDRATGHADERHAFIGARLMGGEHKAGGAITFSYPLPTPGGEAVFQIKSATKGRYGHTSRVEKVVVRLRVTHAPLESGERLWEQITSTFRGPT